MASWWTQPLVYIPEHGKIAGSIINDIGRIQQNRRANQPNFGSPMGSVGRESIKKGKPHKELALNQLLQHREKTNF